MNPVGFCSCGTNRAVWKFTKLIAVLGHQKNKIRQETMRFFFPSGGLQLYCVKCAVVLPCGPLRTPPQQLPRHSLRAGASISWPVCSLLESRAVGFCVCLKSILQLKLCRSLQAFCKLQRELCSLHVGQGTLTEDSCQFTGGDRLSSVPVSEEWGKNYTSNNSLVSFNPRTGLPNKGKHKLSGNEVKSNGNKEISFV